MMGPPLTSLGHALQGRKHFSKVDGKELLDEEMIKLPINVANRTLTTARLSSCIGVGRALPAELSVA